MTAMKSAVISDDEQYRYLLERDWTPGEGARVLFVMLNPSTADANVDDPTIRRCINFAKREEGGALAVVNLFAYRATNPAALDWPDDPVGPLNDDHIAAAASLSDIIVAAWGASPIAAGRAQRVMYGPLDGHTVYCLGETKNGSPRHPLYVRADAPMVEWRPI